MLQKVNLVLMIIVLLAVIGVSVQMYVTQRYNTLAIQELSMQMTEQSMAANAAASDEAPTVLVEGDVERPGWYEVGDRPGEETYLHELIEKAGVEPDKRVMVNRPPYRSVADVLSPSATPILIKPGDKIYVTEAQPDEPTGIALDGIWRQIDDDGIVVEDGMTLAILGADDVRNLERNPAGQLMIPRLDHRLRLEFEGDIRRQRPGTSRPARADNLVIHGGFESADDFEHGRWTMEDDQLLLNLSVLPGAPDDTVRIAFIKVEEEVGPEDLQPAADFEAATEQARQDARADRDRVEALTRFISDMLAQQDPQAGHEITVEAVLREAEGKLDAGVIDDPEIEAHIREAIRKAREAQDEEPPNISGPGAPGGGGP